MCPTSSSPMRRSLTVARIVVAGIGEQPDPGRSARDGPGRGPRQLGQEGQRGDVDAARVQVERVGRVPLDERGPRRRARALADVEPVQPDAAALEAQVGGGGVEGLAVGGRLVEPQPPHPEQAGVVPVEPHLAGGRPLDEVALGEPERGPDAGGRERLEPHERVHLLAAVAPGPAQREPPVDRHGAAAPPEVPVDDVEIRVLHHELAAARAPIDVPGLHVLAGEGRLDARRLEVAEKHAVEGAVAVDRERAGGRARRGHDGGQQAVALLPVRAGHVEGDARVRTPRGASRQRRCGSTAWRGMRLPAPTPRRSPGTRAPRRAETSASSGRAAGPDAAPPPPPRRGPARGRRAAPPAGGASRTAPSPAKSAKRPIGHSRRLRPEARPVGPIPRTSRASRERREPDAERSGRRTPPARARSPRAAPS